LINLNYVSEFILPNQVRPYPKATERKVTKRVPVKSAILTSSSKIQKAFRKVKTKKEKLEKVKNKLVVKKEIMASLKIEELDIPVQYRPYLKVEKRRLSKRLLEKSSDVKPNEIDRIKN
jgi:hypothetical protein